MWIARQGDPFFPSLFILAVDVLARLLKQAGTLGLIEGIGNQVGFKGITSLQFVDDMLLFYAGKEDDALETKTILLAFKEALDLKINLLWYQLH